MKIHKALKVKNRLAGEVARLQEILKRENSRRNDNPSTVDCNKIDAELNENFTKLIQIKAATAQASAPIANKLAELTELKNHINFIKSLPTRKGPELVLVGRDQEKIEYQWNTFLSREDVDKLTAGQQIKVNNLQDDIDVFNANTEVDYKE